MTNRVERLGRGCPARASSHGDRHRFNIEGEQRIAIRRVARLKHTHALASIEARQKRERETCRRASHDHHSINRNLHAVPLLVMLGDATAQAHQPRSVGIAKRAVLHCVHCCGNRGGRCRRCGLADFEMHHPMAGGFAL